MIIMKQYILVILDTFADDTCLLIKNKSLKKSQKAVKY